jgi:hypothetical protein
VADRVTSNKTSTQKTANSAPAPVNPSTVADTAKAKQNRPASTSTGARTTSPTSSLPKNIKDLKSAYRSGQIDKVQYREVATRIKAQYESRINQLKQDYKNQKISKETYKEQVKLTKRAYTGE